MSRVLYIKASPRTDRSHSLAVADAFLEAYRRAHPGDEVVTLDLFREDLPAFDLEAVSAKYKIIHGQDHSEQDENTWRNIVAIIERFKSADKYVWAVPMWNFSIPYRLKQYIDILVQPGHTFTVSADGNYEGLVKNKPAVVVYARGGAYPEGSPMAAYDFQKPYLELILGFIGLTNVQSLVVEGTLSDDPEGMAQRKAQAISKARELAGQL